MAVDGRALSPNFGVSGRPKGKPRAATHEPIESMRKWAQEPRRRLPRPAVAGGRVGAVGRQLVERISMKDMTEKQALAEAVRRWGASGAIRLRTDSSASGRVLRGRLARYRCVVGNGGLGTDCSIERSGQYLAGGISGCPTSHCQRIGGVPM